MARRTKTASSSIQGLKAVITTAAVAATIGGWAALAHHRTPASSATATPTSGAAINPAPLPTLVPLMLPTANTAVAPEREAALPALRDVQPQPPIVERPAPVTITRSSR